MRDKLGVDMSNIQDEKLRSEILNLFQYTQRMRIEIAQMNAIDGKRTRFETVSEQLDAIVQSTEDATNGILEQLEDIDELVVQIRQSNAAGDVGALCDKIGEKTMRAIEACTFQDVTGQRITRVFKSIQFVEERVNAMIDLWGRDDIEALGIELPDDKPVGDEALLNGPQLPGEEISQEEIDKLFA
jgi:chemotaxis protein CheZ